MSGEDSLPPITRVASDPETPKVDTDRRESGVFLSPQHSRETDPTHLMTSRRGQLESGYRSGQSESSCLSHDPSPRMAQFFMPADHESDDASETLLLDSGAHSEPAEDQVPDQDTDDDLDECPSPSTHSTPVAIPSASLHEAEGGMLRLMEATPPRTYLQPYGSAPEDYHGQYRHSTGCLSISPAMVTALSRLRDTQTANCVRQGLRVTSGRLRASNSRASLAQRRKSDAPLPPLELTSDRSMPEILPASRDTPGLSRDRSRSAPDICSVRVQRQCAQELRKISDEFFAHFHGTTGGERMVRTRSRTQSQSVSAYSLSTNNPRRLPASFPGSGARQHSSTWWQAIIQSIAPRQPHHDPPATGVPTTPCPRPDTSSLHQQEDR